MQCEEAEIELPAPPPAFNLDSALEELGMLATRAHSQHEYIKKGLSSSRPKQLLTINARYIRSVDIGCGAWPTTPHHVRYKPYQLLTRHKREERHRTRSENNDSDSGGGASASNANLIKAMLEMKLNQGLDDLSQLKKAKSLESIVTENNDTSVNLTEVEVVSDCIQNLRVGE